MDQEASMKIQLSNNYFKLSLFLEYCFNSILVIALEIELLLCYDSKALGSFIVLHLASCLASSL